MTTKTLLALSTLSLLILRAGPAFAFSDDDNKDKGKDKGRAEAVMAKGKPVAHAEVRDARSFKGAPSGYSAGNRYTATGKTFSGSGRGYGSGEKGYSTKNYSAKNYSSSSRSYASYGGGGGGRHGGGYNYAFREHDGWSHDRHYFWNGHHYGWFDDGWVIIDPGYEYGYAPGYYAVDGGGGSVGVQVQAALAHDGYYQGPIDGIIGPGTSGAIAAYQRDNDLPVTGTITHSLLATMGID